MFEELVLGVLSFGVGGAILLSLSNFLVTDEMLVKAVDKEIDFRADVYATENILRLGGENETYTPDREMVTKHVKRQLECEHGHEWAHEWWKCVHLSAWFRAKNGWIKPKQEKKSKDSALNELENGA